MHYLLCRGAEHQSVVAAQHATWCSTPCLLTLHLQLSHFLRLLCIHSMDSQGLSLSLSCVFKMYLAQYKICLSNTYLSCQTYKLWLQVGDGDWFWEANGSLQFPEMAGNVDVALKQYQEVCCG